MSARGAACPVCGGWAAREPGGLRCLTCGATPIYRRVLPSDHWLSGWDWRNRVRQWALDRCFSRPAEVEAALDDMIDALERRVTVTAALEET